MEASAADPGWREMEPQAFGELVEACGLGIGPEEVRRLAERQLIQGWLHPEGHRAYSLLHLWLVEQYMRAVTAAAHPWGKAKAPVGIADVSRWSDGLNALLERLEEGRQPEKKAIEEVVQRVEEAMEAIDPFGPVGQVFGWVRGDIRQSISNQGRLYLELKRGLAGLEEALAETFEDEGGEAQTPEAPKTRPMFGVEAPKPPPTPVESQDSPAREAIDEVMSAAGEEGPSTGSTIELDPEVDLGFEEAAQEFEQEESAGLEEESEPIVLLEEEVGDGFERQAQTTERTRALNERLEELRVRDRERRTEAAEEGSKGDGPPLDPSERIRRLNRRREVYLKMKEWPKLAELYEEGIELFGEPEERRQIFLVLAMLYEVKLRQPDKAFGAFARAWAVEGESEGKDKAWEGLQRLGRSAGLSERYGTWLGERLDEPLDDGRRIQCARELALATFADGEYQQALEIFWEALEAVDAEAIDEEAVEQFHRLGAHAESGFEERLRSLRQRPIQEPAKAAVQQVLEEVAGAGL